MIDEQGYGDRHSAAAVGGSTTSSSSVSFVRQQTQMEKAWWFRCDTVTGEAVRTDRKRSYSKMEHHHIAIPIPVTDVHLPELEMTIMDLQRTLTAPIPLNLQAKVAKMVTETFGEMLFTPKKESLAEFLSPESLKRRFIMSTKPPKEYVKAKEAKPSGNSSQKEQDASVEKGHSKYYEDSDMTCVRII
ncbi:unnamed protein product [Lactuca virosa]|uniref:Phosphatidylinositol-specific phospholipase C X domain-containing protein n=1 Tax=Lactuca virosa TaxID=75947 RepID=A0AAU9MU85_9ASTR|nr:unnamed protein product [Lactuca virosa]